MHQSISARLRLALSVSLLASLSPAAWAAQAPWPVPPSRLNLSTPFGTLSVKNSEYVYESTLMLNNAEVSPKIEGIVNITYAFSMPKSQAALISVNNGSYQCPIAYRWVILRNSGYTVSPQFGSCSPQIRVSVRGHQFTLQTPSNQEPNKIDVFVYDGRSIRHRTKP
jgi:hypothetical protein